MSRESKTERVVRLIKEGKIDKVSRWDVSGCFWKIINSLKNQGLLTGEIYDRIQHLEDCAKESL